MPNKKKGTFDIETRIQKAKKCNKCKNCLKTNKEYKKCQKLFNKIYTFNYTVKSCKYFKKRRYKKCLKLKKKPKSLT